MARQQRERRGVAPGVSGRPAPPSRVRPRRTRGTEAGRPPVRHGRALAVAAGGLALVVAVLVSTVQSVGGGSGADGAAGGGSGRAPAGGAREVSAGPEGSLRSERKAKAEVRAEVRAEGPGSEPKPERCADGERAAASLRPSGKSGPAVRRIQRAGRLVVGVDQNSYLWGYRDPATGRLEGFDIDLVKAIGKDLLGEDAKITYRTVPTEKRIAAVQRGEVDMVVRTMTISCDRSLEVAFSTAYFEAGQQLVVPRSSARVTGFDESLRGSRLCYAEGSTAQELMRQKGFRALGARPVVVPNQLDCLVRMQLGAADATLTDSALGAGQVAQDPSVELVGEPETVEPYGVAMNRKDRDLVRRVNKVLNSYRKGGEDSDWSASYRRWLADSMMGTEDGGAPSPPTPVYRD